MFLIVIFCIIIGILLLYFWQDRNLPSVSLTNPSFSSNLPKSSFHPISQLNLREAADTLARAFEDDPLAKTYTPTDRRLQRLRVLFEAAMRLHGIEFNLIWSDDHYRAVAFWFPAKLWPTPLWSLIRFIPAALATTGWRPKKLIALLRMIFVLEHHHHQIKEDHYYLQLLGVDPCFQNQGIGSILLAPMLDRFDREGKAAYLESSNPRNVPFYSRHGFEKVKELIVNGEVVTNMLRKPRIK